MLLAAAGWCTGRVVVPLVFQHGAAETVFTVTVVVWAALSS